MKDFLPQCRECAKYNRELSKHGLRFMVFGDVSPFQEMGTVYREMLAESSSDPELRETMTDLYCSECESGFTSLYSPPVELARSAARMEGNYSDFMSVPEDKRDAAAKELSGEVLGICVGACFCCFLLDLIKDPASYGLNSAEDIEDI